MESADTPAIQWDNFVKFVRQLSHDLRNQLNAAELQAALIGEITTDAELKPEVMRLRELVGKLGATLQHLSAAVAPPHLTRLPYSANDLLKDLQKKIVRDFPQESQRIKWELSADDITLEVDPTLIGWAMGEIIDNAFRHGSGQVAARAYRRMDEFIFELLEPKNEAAATAPGSELLSAVKHGHYGLGLRRARAAVSAHGGRLTSEFDSQSSTLTSRITLPCSAEPS